MTILQEKNFCVNIVYFNCSINYVPAIYILLIYLDYFINVISGMF